MKYNIKNINRARKLRKGGIKHNSLRIILEWERLQNQGYDFPLSYAATFIEKESGNGRNVFGHDPTNSIPKSWKGTTVTKDKYLVYKRNRKAGLGMQGVGPMQLTWWEFQDQADALGGCWKPQHNIRIGFLTAAKLIKQYGRADGVRRYNGNGPQAQQYKRDFFERQKRWHKLLS